MKSTDNHPSLEAHIGLLERRADVVRSRLLRTVDALDTRRHQVTELGTKAKKLVIPVAISVVGLFAVGVGVALGIRALVRARHRRSLEWRMKHALDRFRAEEKRPYWQELLQKAGLTLVSITVSEIGRRITKNALDGRTPDGRLLVGKALDAHHEALAVR